MDDILQPIINLIPAKWHTTAALILPITMVMGRVYHTITTGGGLRGIVNAVWFGTNAPKNKPVDPPTTP